MRSAFGPGMTCTTERSDIAYFCTLVPKAAIPGGVESIVFALTFGGTAGLIDRQDWPAFAAAVAAAAAEIAAKEA